MATEDFICDPSTFKQTIKASQSEILKDFQQINNSAISIKKIVQVDVEPKKIAKIKSSQRIRKTKLSITEDIGPILGFASLINEIDTFQPTPPKKKLKQIKGQGSKKGQKINQAKEVPKFCQGLRAETHVSLAHFICRKIGKKTYVYNF
ncbi:hypothetical protein SteCoe_3367 [Stentor coeruleus]|uniref:Uncharacterized protein n=1 Tax=Stentor coeruleus TaxID=5963 RepID=A0A1R2CXD2_9CILI|nr:hypothetical protein SteCoe_3367 [Stentor coeruleus]